MSAASRDDPHKGATVSQPGLILVDDDPLITETLSFILAEDYEVHTANSRSDVKSLLQGLDEVPSIALVDLGLPPYPHVPDEGFALISELLVFNNAMKILILSGQSDRGNIRHALTLGAVDFIPKPCDGELLKARLQHQLMILEAERPAPASSNDIEEILTGKSSVMQTLRALVTQFADTPFPVLIEGESGSGKELVAVCLHQQSARADAPLLTINCAAFNAELLEAQLFGHAKGAFTGADLARQGFFEQANNGMLFLDEVGEMPLALQSKFLRVLENGEYYRLGETQPRYSNARIIAATNRDIRQAVRTGGFRQDLFHRLSVLSISVPPLRERAQDWQILMDRFLQQYSGTIKSFELEPSAAALFSNYGFPGNVRELRNIVVRLGAKYQGQSIDANTLEQELELPLDPLIGQGDQRGENDVALKQRLTASGFQLDDELSSLERRFVEIALRMSEGNLSKAARLLGVNRTTLYSRVARLGLGDPGE